MKVLILLLISGLYWQIICQITGAKEPWDSGAYWSLWYPLSFVVAAVVGYLFRNDGWLAGLILTFAQVPVIWINSGTGPLIIVGLPLLCVLAVPPSAISLLAGRFAVRVHSA